MLFHIFCGEFGLYQFLTDIIKMCSAHFSSFIFYCIVLQGAGNDSNECTSMSSEPLFDDIPKDYEMNDDDDLVSILSE